MRILKWIAALLVQVNLVRKEYKLPPVDYNYRVTEYLEVIRDSYGPQYFYEKGVECHYVELVNRTQCNKGDFIRPQGFRNGNSRMLFHDTYAPGKFNRVIQYRINQKNCFDFNKCNGTKYYDYITCLKNKPDLNYDKPPNKCIWSWYYFPRMLENTTEIACVQLDHRTPHVPPGLDQPLSFYCYSDAADPTTDRPFALN